MKEDAGFEEFVQGYFDRGERAVPEIWPRELRRRCIFFLRMLEDSGPAVGVQSSLSGLAGAGVPCDFSLPGSEPARGAAPLPDLRGGGERYVVEEEIARGGMGRILLAYDRDFPALP